VYALCHCISMFNVKCMHVQSAISLWFLDRAPNIMNFGKSVLLKITKALPRNYLMLDMFLRIAFNFNGRYLAQSLTRHKKQASPAGGSQCYLRT